MNHPHPYTRCIPQVISLAGWVNIMYFIQDSHSFWNWMYFVSLIVVSALLNACQTYVEGV